MSRNVLFALAVIAASGIGVLVDRLAAPPRPLDASTGEVVARARRVEVHGSDLEAALAGPAGANASAVVEGIARTRYLARLAEDAGLQRDPEFTRQYAESLAALYLQRKFEEPERKRAPADDEVRGYFEAHRAEIVRPERARLALIALIAAAPDQRASKRKAADAALAQLRGRTADPFAFGELARVRSDLPEAAATNGELPPLSREELTDRFGAPLADAAFRLGKTGEVHPGVVETERGFFLVKLLGREPARNPSFDELKDVMRARLTRERREQHRKEFLDAIWKEADIRIDEAALARAVGEAKKQEQAQAKQRR
ncbi:peptidylprolyl isomerase [Anaeromyxobacter oryzisoli]|uniref:peptidylprolyl isomerase n=1 Tax=Anaeromyxobacter oryzisoli TaxID=2925408 RepID=UPI00241342CD|nr:peptidylprolyl isomerase [Anaeromyxobacter sp. SG63]